MTRILHAWLEGRYAGRFLRDSAGVIRFEYDNAAPEAPISLSLPREGVATRRAAGNFLENLLPDHMTVRRQMASAYGVASTDMFDLLEQAGADVAGGLVLSAQTEPSTTGVPILDPASGGDIAARITAIKHTPERWTDSGSPARFSLAGTQGKFALAEIGGEWYWSNATVPSTHIVKPARPDLSGLEAAETVALTLAAEVGISAPPARILRVEDQTAYLVKRFDRAHSGRIAARLHAEDIAQAMGKGPEEKYNVSAGQVIRLLRDRIDDEAAYGFVRQLAFNIFLGNADAHAKNYSVLLRPTSVDLAPMYDVVPVGLYPEFDQKLAMPISGAKHAAEVLPAHWRKLARVAGLDEDRVEQLVQALAQAIEESIAAVATDLDPGRIFQLRALIDRNTAKYR